jgi:excisionase family DNA binding protein
MVEPLLNADQAGELLGVPRTWMLQKARDGVLPHVKLGHYTRFERSALQAWLSDQRRGT